MKGGIDLLYIFQVNFRIADGNFTWDLIFCFDYLYWGSSSARVFVCRLILGLYICLLSIELFLLKIYSTYTYNCSSIQCARIYSNIPVYTYERTITPNLNATLIWQGIRRFTLYLFLKILKIKNQKSFPISLYDRLNNPQK